MNDSRFNGTAGTHARGGNIRPTALAADGSADEARIADTPGRKERIAAPRQDAKTNLGTLQAQSGPLKVAH